MRSKLKFLLNNMPFGSIVTSAWLQENGISRQLAHKYQESGWLESFGHGAFVRSGDEVDWLGGVYALQKDGIQVHIAADTALDLKGYAHFLSIGDRKQVTLFGGRQERLPAWFKNHDWQVSVRFVRPSLFDVSEPFAFSLYQSGAFSVRVSAPERAILEVLHLVRSNEEIQHAIERLNGLGSLRPDIIQKLLYGCRSIKVKRAFLWMADYSGHDWADRLDRTGLDLGSGNRQFYKDGVFDAKYRITVPKGERTQNGL